MNWIFPESRNQVRKIFLSSHISTDGLDCSVLIESMPLKNEIPRKTWNRPVNAARRCQCLNNCVSTNHTFIISCKSLQFKIMWFCLRHIKTSYKLLVSPPERYITRLEVLERHPARRSASFCVIKPNECGHQNYSDYEIATYLLHS